MTNDHPMLTDHDHEAFRQEAAEGITELRKAPVAERKAEDVDALWQRLIEKYPGAWAEHYEELKGSWYLQRRYGLTGP